MKFSLSPRFINELPADPEEGHARRQVRNACYSFVKPKQTKQASLVHVADDMMDELGLTQEDVQSQEFLEVMTGNKVLEGTQPYAMCYGGHQFGNWAGQLGDGRAINLFEVEHEKQHWVLQLKGAGETPYSRSADGLAVLRSSIREYLCSEAMYHLGVPTTRALSLALSGDDVLRDMMYNGNQAYEKGAIVCRVAPSFIRFGNFQILAARKELDHLKALTDHTIRYFYPEIPTGTKEGYLAFFREVALRTLDMVIHWQRVGFVHGVMNTDNMSILGQTIDYGPYGWLEGYEHGWTPNTTDSQHKRYRYGNQPNIALWNLLQLANALYTIIEDVPGLEAVLDEYQTQFEVRYIDMMRSKIGLEKQFQTDVEIIKELEENLRLVETDMTIFFRELALHRIGDSIERILDKVTYTPLTNEHEAHGAWQKWFQKYDQRLKLETATNDERYISMNAVNPKYVLRNYMAQLAIDAADEGDYSLIDELYTMLKNPYDDQAEYEKWYVKRPEWAREKVGCSMLSCSS